MNKRELGKTGEDAASRYLSENGIGLLARNFRFSRMGEIDIIARERDTLCFIEVKTRSGTLYGTPAEAVSPAKRNTIVRLAQIYMQQKKYYDKPIRFDVIEVFVNRDHAVTTINHIRNAF